MLAHGRRPVGAMVHAVPNLRVRVRPNMQSQALKNPVIIHLLRHLLDKGPISSDGLLRPVEISRGMVGVITFSRGKMF
jgi:hypothetical protein